MGFTLYGIDPHNYPMSDQLPNTLIRIERAMTTYDEIMKEFKQEIAQGIDLDDIQDRSHEYVDNYVPVYNNRIIEEWQAMPSDYDNRGSAEMGHSCQEINIISLMGADLYLYYQDLVALVLDDLSEELESVE